MLQVSPISTLLLENGVQRPISLLMDTSNIEAGHWLTPVREKLHLYAVNAAHRDLIRFSFFPGLWETEALSPSFPHSPDNFTVRYNRHKCNGAAYLLFRMTKKHTALTATQAHVMVTQGLKCPLQGELPMNTCEVGKTQEKQGLSLYVAP